MIYETCFIIMFVLLQTTIIFSISQKTFGSHHWWFILSMGQLFFNQWYVQTCIFHMCGHAGCRGRGGGGCTIVNVHVHVGKTCMYNYFVIKIKIAGLTK